MSLGPISESRRPFFDCRLAQLMSEAQGQGRLLREACPDDLATILVLERYCFSPWLAFGKKHWRRLLMRHTRRIWLLFAGDQLIAYLVLLPHQGWHRVGVVALAVHWQYRRQGIATWLLKLAELEARSRELKRIQLEVDCENAGAIELYQRLGFVAQRELPDYYGFGRPGLNMVLPVQGHASLAD